MIFTAGELLEKSEGTYVYKMVCGTAGTIGNSYSGKLLPVTAIASLTSAVLGDIMVPGEDEETDERLRQKYNESFKTVRLWRKYCRLP